MANNAARSKGARNSGPKILRLGIIQNGKIIEERLLRKRQPVTLGSHSKNTFHVVSDIPRTMTIFDFRNNQYSLCFNEKMEGRVSLGDGVHDLVSLRKSTKVKRQGNQFLVPLNERCRGKVVLGDVTVLFQFVTPPPPRAKPTLPASMRGGLIIGMGMTLILCLAISALLQGGSVAWIVSQDWPEPRDVKALPDRFVRVLAPPEEKKKDEPEDKPEPEKAEGEGEKKPVEKKPEPKKQVKKPNPKPVDPDKKAAEESARKKALSKKVESKTILKVIGAVSSDQGSLVDALVGGADRRSLDDAFADSTGVKQATAGAGRSGLHRVGSSDATATGSKATIGDLKGSKVAAKANVDSGSKGKAVKVKARVNLRSTERVVGSGVVDKKRLAAVFRARGGALQSCYERELKKNPKIGGKLIVKFTIGTAGRVTAASIAKDSVGSSAVGKCVVSRIRGWKFPKPEGGSVSVSKSIVFSSGN